MVVRSLIENGNKECLKQVVIGEDRNIINDYSHELEEYCMAHRIKRYKRNKSYKIQKCDYYIAAGWKWLIRDIDIGRLIIFHDSLLPRYRGFSPLVSALLNHEREIGVTVIRGSNKYDEGDIIAQSSIQVNYPVIISDIIDIVSHEYYRLTKKIINIIRLGKIEKEGIKQDEKYASYSLWRDEEDYRIDWKESSKKIEHFISCVGYPYKGAFTFIDNEKYRLFEGKSIEDVKIENRSPGKVLFKDDGHPVVVCGKGLLLVKSWKKENGDPLPMDKFRLRFT